MNNSLILTITCAIVNDNDYNSSYVFNKCLKTGNVEVSFFENALKTKEINLSEIKGIKVVRSFDHSFNLNSDTEYYVDFLELTLSDKTICYFAGDRSEFDEIVADAKQELLNSIETGLDEIISETDSIMDEALEEFEESMEESENTLEFNNVKMAA